MFQTQFTAAYPEKRHLYAATKRLADLMLVPVLGCLAAPMILFVLLLNPILNPGPLFFSQMRVGRGQVPFRMYKLRTMTGVRNLADGATHAARQAHRTTRFARLLRDLRIDELPQIWNVLRGDMSFIGPRPEQPNLYADYARQIPGFADRQAVRPGLTGLAQVKLGYTHDVVGARAKLAYDLEYIEGIGAVMDARIAVATLKVLLRKVGSQ